MLDVRWSAPAWTAATIAAATPREERRRWSGQNGWDAEHMRTVSTRLPTEEAARLERYCREAGITRYQLLGYMIKTWMAGWEEVAHR